MLRGISFKVCCQSYSDDYATIMVLRKASSLIKSPHNMYTIYLSGSPRSDINTNSSGCFIKTAELMFALAHRKGMLAQPEKIVLILLPT